MEAGGLERDDAERVAHHAGGNPFFIIEITGMLLRDERDLPADGPGAHRPVLLPATVQAVIAARIDHLSPDARELVRRASVFPRGRFDEEELSLIVEPRPELLEEADDEELLVPDEDRPGVWRFRSDVLRDVAYESLAKRERQRLHLRVAKKLAAPAHADRYPRTIAFHLEQAARAALDLNPKDRTLADRAVEALANAGDVARRRFESRAAADLYVRALSLAGPEERWSEREAWIVSRCWGSHGTGSGSSTRPSAACARAGGGRRRRPRDGPRGALPRRHHAHDPRRRRTRGRAVRAGRSRRRAASATPTCWSRTLLMAAGSRSAEADGRRPRRCSGRR